MVMVLEQEMVNAIADCGRAAHPNEACGLLLPTRLPSGAQVIELPNRSKEPLDSVEMRGEDMLSALERVGLGDMTVDMLGGLTVWHTHPRGHVGPSRFDFQNASPLMRNLVVTLFDDGRPPLATWY